MYNTLHISGKKARKLVDNGALLIDTRSPVQFRDGTLTGATNISARQMSTLMKHPRDTKIVFFGDNEVTTNVIINYAISMGFTNVYTFGTIDEWNS